MEFVLSSPEVILVTTPEPSSLTDAYSLLKALFRNPAFQPGLTEVKVLANRVTDEEEAKGIYEKLNTVSMQFLAARVAYLGMIPQDAQLEKAVRKQKPVSLLYPEAKSSLAYGRVAATLSEVPLAEEKKRGISGLLKDLLSRRNG